MAARCETVLNTTMAEIETYHTQKQEDFQALTKDHLDGEIALHEQVLFYSISLFWWTGAEVHVGCVFPDSRSLEGCKTIF